jgi:glycosyltransferase involved in cell wall biosynthesis
MTRTKVHTVLVAVPAQNEEGLLPRCLAALEAAVSRLAESADAPRVAVMLALDSCDDGSATIAAAYPFPWLEVNARNVGVARAAAIDRLLEQVPAADLGSTWIANTDADSAVPTNWLTEQAELAASGVDLVVGTVRPDLAELDPARRRAWLATHTLGVANGHVHGANLGIRADVYTAIGGFTAVTAHEDVALVAAAMAAGARQAATDACWVLTSARIQGRAAGGYARYLREDLGGNLVCTAD